MQKTRDGRGDTKLVTPEQHNEVRRAKKARQRAHARVTVSTGNLFAEIEQDHVNERGLKMLSIFDTLMVSSSPAAQDTLRLIALKYVSYYTQPQHVSLYKRHQSAKDAALRNVGPANLRSFAATQLDRAENLTHPAR